MQKTSHSPAAAFFGIRVQPPPTLADGHANQELVPRHFPLGTLAESPRRHERAPITFGSCPHKLPLGRLPPFGNSQQYSPRADVNFGPNVRAQPVVSVTRAAAFAGSGYPHTLLMREVSKKTPVNLNQGMRCTFRPASRALTLRALRARARHVK